MQGPKWLGLPLVAVLALAPALALGGSPHFVTCTATIEGNNLSVDGKVAGLGNETQVHIEVTGDAACINPGTKKPKAANKEAFAAEGDFPVQNGKAVFSLDVEATFQPSCSPPMTVVWSNVTACDSEHEICCTLN